ncbi:hypothetical protein THAOC_22741, partial [Thalassiosira oceanica]
GRPVPPRDHHDARARLAVPLGPAAAPVACPPAGRLPAARVGPTRRAAPPPAPAAHGPRAAGTALDEPRGPVAPAHGLGDEQRLAAVDDGRHHQQQQEAVVHLEHTHHGAPTPSVPIPVGGNPPPLPVRRPSRPRPRRCSGRPTRPGPRGALGASLMERNYSDRSGGGAAATSGGSPPGPEPLAGGGGGADTLMERDYSETNFASPSPETHGGAGRTERIPEPRSAEDGPSAARAEVPSAAKVEDDETVDAEG